MTSAVTEIERKYEAAGDGAPNLAALDRLPGVTGSDLAPEELEAVYYDTDGLALLGAGITLRRREGGHDAGWHLKLPAGTDTRTEVRRPLTAADEGVPTELSWLVAGVTRGRPLAPVARIATSRAGRRIADPGGDALAEVVVDRVRAEDLRDAGVAAHWVEVEAELASGTPDLLDAIESVLADAGLRRSGSGSKLARVLGRSGPARATAPEITRRSTAGDLLRPYLAAQVAAIVRYDVGVRRDSPDSVHRARVAIRRLRSTLSVFREFLDPEVTRPVADELRWFGGNLGTARDAEVQQARLAADERLTDTDRARVAAFFERRRSQARAVVLASLDGPRYRRLLDTLDGLAAAPPFTEAATRPAAVALPPAVRHAVRVARRDVRRATRTVEDRDATVHRARRAAKRARYALEVVGPLHPAEAKRCAAAVAAFQDVIGEYQDSVVARRTLVELAEDADHDGASSFGFGRSHEHQACVAAGIVPTLRPAWRRVGRAARPLCRAGRH